MRSMVWFTFAEWLLDGQFLIPILEQIRKVAFGQLEAIIQGHEGQHLTFPRAIGHTLQVESAEDGHVIPHVQFLQPVDLLAVGQGQGRTKIAGPMTIEKSLHHWLPARSSTSHKSSSTLWTGFPSC